MLSCFSHVWLFATLWTLAHQAPLFMGFSRQEYWSRLPCPPPGDLPNPEIKPPSLMSPALAGRVFTTSTPWEAWFTISKSRKPDHQDILWKKKSKAQRGRHEVGQTVEAENYQNILYCRRQAGTTPHPPVMRDVLGGAAVAKRSSVVPLSSLGHSSAITGLGSQRQMEIKGNNKHNQG